jgi:Ni,Fe-hydrogenase I cytochrome b subunit
MKDNLSCTPAEIHEIAKNTVANLLPGGLYLGCVFLQSSRSWRFFQKRNFPQSLKRTFFCCILFDSPQTHITSLVISVYFFVMNNNNNNIFIITITISLYNMLNKRQL